MVPFRKGAWLRLYGILIHAWHDNLFKLCVLECGDYLRTDDMTLERGRFDYARVLISTPSLDIVSCVEKMVIDGILVEIKIIEDWGLNIGEDACLFDDNEDQKSQSDIEEAQGDPEACKNVDTFVDKIVKELAEEEIFTDNMAKEVDKTVEDIHSDILAAMSVLGPQTQPEKVIDDVTS